MRGIDCAFDLTNHVRALSDTEIGFAGRYFSTNIAKDLSPSEAQALSAAGILIVSVWETTAAAALNGAAQGQQDAKRAMVLAKQCGQPEGSCIYFAVDFDATEDQIDVGIIPYFQAIKDTLSGIGGYTVGCYGSAAVLTALKAAGLIEYDWLAQSTGWSGHATYTGSHIVQGPESVALLGQDFPVDTDTAPTNDFGGWTLGGKVVAPVETQGSVPVVAQPSEDDVAATIKTLQQQLALLGYYKGAVDGVYGPLTAAALTEYENV